VLIVITAVLAPNGAPRMLWIVAAVAAAVLIAFTLIINVPINKRTLGTPNIPPRTGRTTAAGGAHLPGGPRDPARGLVPLRRSGHRPHLTRRRISSIPQPEQHAVQPCPRLTSREGTSPKKQQS
jgi:hypothetical protein